MSHSESSISKAIPRPDGMAKATGSALYIADLKFDDPGGNGGAKTVDGGVALGPDAGLSKEMLTGRFFRSPHSRGRIADLRLPSRRPRRHQQQQKTALTLR